MSKLGYIQSSYGKQINIAVANTYAYNVLSGSNLPVNTFIISSPGDEDDNDSGSYAIVMTDSEANGVRLTYTIKEGNGLKYKGDSLSLSIDNDTIIEKDKRLSVNVPNIIDNDTILYTDNKLKVNINSLNHASSTTNGLFKIDEKTIRNDDGLYVSTQNLNYANTSSKMPGIFIGDSKTIKSDQGVLSIIEENLNKATTNTFGTVIGNDYTLSIDSGIASVKTVNLDRGDSENAGIVKPDNSTVVLNENNDLSLNINNLDKATVNTFGVFKYNSSLVIEDNSLKVKNYTDFGRIINNLKKEKEIIDSKIKDIDYLLKEYEVGKQEAEIYDFHCSNLITTVLEKPLYLNQPINEMQYQFISTDFVIATNCPFTISLKYEDNTDPKVSLYSINYDTIDIYNGNSGLMEIFQTTQGRKVPIKMTFLAKNYYKNDVTEYSNKVKIKIIVAYANDLSINKSLIYSIVRFNSAYNEEIVYDETNNELAIDE